jgi:beta-alanine degradation protein BauB
VLGTLKIKEFGIKGGSTMKPLARFLVSLLVATFTAGFATTVVMAQEKAKAEKAKSAPAKETKAQAGNVLLENEKVRVVETRIKPGEKNEMKMRNERVNVYIKPAKLRVHYSDGKKEDFDQKAGSVRFNKAGTSSTENIGKTETHSVIVTPK